MILRVGLVLVSLVLVGCGTTAKQTEKFLVEPRTIPETALVKSAPFINKQVNYCGPSTLAMAMRSVGKNVPVEEVAQQVYTPGLKGTLQEDMISASRRNGMLAVPIHGLPSLMRELAAGHAVIIFENLAFTWFPMWHYALAIGYDLYDEDIILHSGPEAFKHWDLRKFERSWELGDYWGLVVLPPGQTVASADDLAHSAAAVGLERAGKTEEAELVYRSILSRWPKSYSGHIGLSNIAFTKHHFLESVNVLKQAAKLYPDSSVVWHNLAIAQFSAKMMSAAKNSAKHAIELSSTASPQAFRESLEEVLSAIETN
jgi:hypothetical protein